MNSDGIDETIPISEFLAGVFHSIRISFAIFFLFLKKSVANIAIWLRKMFLNHIHQKLNKSIPTSSFIAEATDISSFGSSLAVIHGSNGNVLVNRTRSVAAVFQQLRFFTDNSECYSSTSNLTISSKSVESHRFSRFHLNRVKNRPLPPDQHHRDGITRWRHGSTRSSDSLVQPRPAANASGLRERQNAHRRLVPTLSRPAFHFRHQRSANLPRSHATSLAKAITLAGQTIRNRGRRLSRYRQF